METLGAIFKICMEILYIEIPVGDYKITLFNLLVYTVIAYLVLRLIFKLFFKQEEEE